MTNLPAKLWKMDLLNFHSPRGQSLSCHARDHLPSTDNTHHQQPKNNKTYNTTQHKTLPSNGNHNYFAKGY